MRNPERPLIIPARISLSGKDILTSSGSALEELRGFKLEPQCVIDALADRVGRRVELNCGVEGCALSTIVNGPELFTIGTCVRGKTLGKSLTSSEEDNPDLTR